MRRDDVRLPDGSHATREYGASGRGRHRAAADDGRLVLERQYATRWAGAAGVPAGKIDPGEPTLACAQRELLEETGYTAREWALAGVVHTAAAYSTEGIEIWFARGLQPGVQRLDRGEFLEICLMHEQDLERCASRGELSDVKTMVGLLWLQKWRAGAWTLDWSAAPAPLSQG